MGGSTLFNGTSSVITAPKTTALVITGDLTIGAWVNLKTVTSAADRVIVSYTASTEAEEQNTLYKFVILTNGDLQIFHESGAGTNTVVNSSGAIVAQRGWYYYSVVRDTVAKNYKFYINGVLRHTNAYTNNPTGGDGATANLYIGRDITAAQYMDGKIAEVKIFNSALTASQAQELYSTGSVSVVSPVASYALDDLPSSYIDTIGGATGTGTATVYSPDVPVQQRVLRGGDMASANGSATSAVGSVDTVASNAGTIMGFAFISGTASVTIVSFVDADGITASWRLTMEANTRYPFIFTYNSSAAGTTNPKPSIPLPRNQWFHFAVVQTFSGGNLTGKIYINGKLWGSQTQARDMDVCSRFVANSGTGMYTKSILAYEREVTHKEIKDHCFNRIVPANPKIKWDRQEGAGNINYDSSGNGLDGTGGTLVWSSNVPSKARVAHPGRTLHP